MYMTYSFIPKGVSMLSAEFEAKSAWPIPAPLDLDALNDAAARKSVSASAVRLFLKLAERWGLSVEERCRLLGDISKPTYHNWQNGKVGTLGRDQMERISLLLGLHKGLTLLFADDAAGLRWLKSANVDLAFGGKAPLARALQGSINDLYAVRRYVDSWRGVK
jgi:Protein of unknown function (DUF2384)